MSVGVLKSNLEGLEVVIGELNACIWDIGGGAICADETQS